MKLSPERIPVTTIILPLLNQLFSTTCLTPSSPRLEICLSNIEKYSFLNLTVTTPSVVNKVTVLLALSFAIQVPQILWSLKIFIVANPFLKVLSITGSGGKS